MGAGFFLVRAGFFFFTGFFGAGFREAGLAAGLVVEAEGLRMLWRMAAADWTSTAGV